MKVVDKTIINDGLKKVARDLSERIAKLGFNHTKKWYWVRLNDGYADFIHLHRHGSTYGGQLNYSISFRVYCGNRVLNDDFSGLGLNGPNSDSPEAMQRRYHMRFNAKSGSTYERCIDDLEKFVIEMGEPWFKTHIPSQDARDIENQQNIKQSLKLLGMKSL